MSFIKENEILCECIKCHKIFPFNTHKKIKNEMGGINLVSPCCERNFKLYFDEYTERFLKALDMKNTIEYRE